MKIIADSLTADELRQMASTYFGNLVKAVVDIERRLLAVDADLHSDLESLLLQSGSRQSDLWGINLYPEETGDNFIEYDSMINVRPSQGNRSRGVDDASIQLRIAEVVREKIVA